MRRVRVIEEIILSQGRFEVIESAVDRRVDKLKAERCRVTVAIEELGNDLKNVTAGVDINSPTWKTEFSDF